MLRSYATLYRLAESGQTQALLEHLVELSAELPADTDPPNWALIAAAEANQIETARALLASGANVEGASQRSYIHPLWKAAKRGHVEMVKILLEHGADPSATDNAGTTALDYARRYSKVNVVQLLETLQTPQGKGAE